MNEHTSDYLSRTLLTFVEGLCLSLSLAGSWHLYSSCFTCLLKCMELTEDPLVWLENSMTLRVSQIHGYLVSSPLLW